MLYNLIVYSGIYLKANYLKNTNFNKIKVYRDKQFNILSTLTGFYNEISNFFSSFYSIGSISFTRIGQKCFNYYNKSLII